MRVATFVRLLAALALLLAGRSALAQVAFTSTPVTGVAQGQVYTYNVTTSGLLLPRTVTGTVPSWLTLTANPAAGTATLTSTTAVTAAQVGVHNVSLTVSNALGQTATQAFTITVNGPPAFSSTAPTGANEDALYTYDITTTDPNAGQTRTVSATTLPTWLTLTLVNPTNGTARLSGTPTQAQVGIAQQVTLRVTDNGNPALFTSQTFTITVANVNDAPTFTSSPVTSATQNAVYTYNIATADPDTGGTRTIAATPGSPLPAWLNLTNVNATAGTATLTGTPQQAQVGVPQQVSLRVTDNGSPALFATQAFTITVGDVNDPPQIVAPIPTQLATENAPFQLRDTAGAAVTLAAFFRDIDVPPDPLTFQVTGLPPSGRLVANPATGTITGTPLQADARDTPYVVTVTANDGRSLPATLPTQTFNLTVAALDRADVGLAATAAPSPALVNGNIDWTFTVTNGGPQPSAAATLRADFAGNAVTFTQLGGCTVTPVGNGQQATCSVAPLAAGASAAIVMSGTVAQTGDVYVAAEVTATTPVPIDPNAANNRSSAAVSVAQSVSGGAAQVLASPENTGVAVGDLNGDGFLDLAVAKTGGRGTEIYLSVPNPANAAQRLLTATPLVLDDLTPSTDVLLVDLDGDGDLDLVTTNATGQRNNVFFNSGTAVFTLQAALATGVGNSHAAAAGDFDGDGLMDLAFANTGANTVFVNRGGLTFAAGDTFDSGDHRDVAVADFDLDGLPDLVFANLTGPSRFNRNAGGGQFADGVAIEASGAQAVAVGDFNGDGRPDLVLAHVGAGVPPALAVYRNDPGGAASPSFVSTATFGAAPVVDVLVGDVDGDGLADIVAIGAAGSHQLYRGDGAGGFVLHPVQFTSAAPVAAALGKISVDDRPDVAVAGANDTSLFFNDGSGALGLGDTEPPTIQLLGQASVTLTVESAYQDAGATASDRIDGNLTPRIVVDNPVNTAVVGTYTVTYDVRDSSGNAAARVTRSVRVAPREGTGGGGGGAIGAPLALFGLALYLALAGLGSRKRRW